MSGRELWPIRIFRNVFASKNFQKCYDHGRTCHFTYHSVLKNGTVFLSPKRFAPTLFSLPRYEKDSESTKIRLQDLKKQLKNLEEKLSASRIQVERLKRAVSCEDVTRLVFDNVQEHICQVQKFHAFLSKDVVYSKARGPPSTMKEGVCWEQLSKVLGVLECHRLHVGLEPANGRILQEFLRLDQEHKLILENSLLQNETSLLHRLLAERGLTGDVGRALPVEAGAAPAPRRKQTAAEAALPVEAGAAPAPRPKQTAAEARSDGGGPSVGGPPGGGSVGGLPDGGASAEGEARLGSDGGASVAAEGEARRGSDGDPSVRTAAEARTGSDGDPSVRTTAEARRGSDGGPSVRTPAEARTGSVPSDRSGRSLPLLHRTDPPTPDGVTSDRTVSPPRRCYIGSINGSPVCGSSPITGPPDGESVAEPDRWLSIGGPDWWFTTGEPEGELGGRFPAQPSIRSPERPSVGRKDGGSDGESDAPSDGRASHWSLVSHHPVPPQPH